MKHIYLIGFMGVGKTTVAAELSRRMELPTRDTDEEMVRHYGCTVNEMFARWGEAVFRQRETEMLLRLSRETASVISCGGGIALRKENVACMKDYGTVVWLTASPDTILSRLAKDESRPLLQGKKNPADIAKLMEQRLPYYEAAADVSISVDGRSPRDICNEIRCLYP